jgi:dolichol kinase
MNGKQEIFRKLIHIISGVLILLGFQYLEWAIFIRILFVLLLLAILFTLIHLKFKIKFLESFTKENEKAFPLKGSIFFVVGSILVMYIFSKDIALASITILTFGDSVSSLASFFGKKYNLNPFRRYKSLFGTFVGMIVAFLFALLFIDPISAIVGSFFGLLSECIAFKLGESDADDNIVVPLVAATAMYLLTKIA